MKSTKSNFFYYLKLNLNLKKEAISILLSLLLLGTSGCSTTPTDNKTSSLDNLDLKSIIPGYTPPTTINEAIANAKTALLHRDSQRAMFELTQGLDLEGEESDKARLYLELGQLHFNAENFDAALYAATKSIEIEPNLTGSHLVLGKIHMKKQAHPAAKYHFERVVDLENRTPATEKTEASSSNQFYALTGLGVIHDLMRRFTDAHKYYLAAIHLSPNSAMALNNYGYSLYLDDNHEQALLFFKKAIQKDGKFEQAWRNLGLVHVRLGNLKLAERYLLRFSEPSEAYNDIGYLLMMAGEHEKAKHYFELSIDNSEYYFMPAYKNIDILSRTQ